MTHDDISLPSPNIDEDTERHAASRIAHLLAELALYGNRPAGGIECNDHQRIWDALDKVRAEGLLHGDGPHRAERIAACWAENSHFRGFPITGFLHDTSPKPPTALEITRSLPPLFQ